MFWKGALSRNTARRLVLLWCLAIAALPACAGTLEDTELKANGLQQTALTIAKTGFYAIRASSEVGVAIRLVDSLRGAHAWHGAASKYDGRIEAVLDAGRYLLQLRGPHAAGSSQQVAKLEVIHATAMGAALNLEESGEVVSSELQEGRYREFSFEVFEPRAVFLELAGRALADARIWRDDGWVVPDRRERGAAEPRPGESLTAIRLVAKLTPGRYHLRAYGGAPRVWATGSSAMPLFLRAGIKQLARTYHARHVMSPFGTDRFLVPRAPDTFRLSLPLPEDASVGVRAFNDAWPFAPVRRADRVAVMSKDQRSRSVELRVPRPTPGTAQDSANWDVVSVSAAAGRSYLLELAHQARRVVVPAGSYWVESRALGDPADEAPVSALAFTGKRNQLRRHLVASQAVEFIPEANWRGQFNLTGFVELFVHVKADGEFRVTGTGVAADYVFRRYNHDANDSVLRPDRDGLIELAEGFYRFRLKARVDGIHQLQIRGSSAMPETRPLPTVSRFQKLVVPRGHEGVVRIADGYQGNDFVLRKLPLNLMRPLQLTLAAGESLSVPVRLSSAGIVRLHMRDDAVVIVPPVPAEAGTRLDVAAGDHLITVRNRGVRTAVARIAFDVEEMARSLPPQRRVQPLYAGQSRAIELIDAAHVSIPVSIKKRGWYVLASEGLLALGARLRTRAQANGPDAASNAAGRNFSLGVLLDPGDYQLDVRAQGASRGRAFVWLRRARSAQFPELVAGRMTGVRIGPDAVGLLPVQVASDGHYDLRTFTQLREVSASLSATGAWPLWTSSSPDSNPAPVYLRRGRYQLAIAPGAFPRQVGAMLTALPETSAFVGHGPHVLALNRTVTHRWNVRAPDTWRFTLPAATDIEVSLTGGMRATLVDGNEHTLDVAETPLSLRAGDYRLIVSHPDGANFQKYSLRIAAASMLPGMRRTLTTPARVAISVPPEGNIELTSQGRADVRAVLRDADGVVVAHNDDDGANWNFALREKLAPGTYTLDVHGIAASAVQTELLYAMGTEPEARTAVASLLSRNKNAASETAATGMQATPLENAIGTQLIALLAGSRTQLRWPDRQGGQPGRVTLTLPAGVSVSVDGQVVTGARPGPITLDLQSEAVVLGNDGSTTALVSASVARPTSKILYTKVPGIWHTQIDADALLIGHSDTAIVETRDAATGPARTVRVLHKSGRVELAEWQASQFVATPMTGDTVLSLGSSARRLVLHATAARMLRVRASAPIASRLMGSDHVPLIAKLATEHWHLVPPGRHELLLASNTDDVSVAIEHHEAEPLVEGNSQPSPMAPGERSLFEFVWTHAGRIGLGARATDDRLHLRLHDRLGRVMAEGRNLFQPLARGRYLLVLQNDAPVAQYVRPLLVGQQRPRGVPAAVERSYLARFHATEDR